MSAFSVSSGIMNVYVNMSVLYDRGVCHGRIFPSIAIFDSNLIRSLVTEIL